jgi:hypothetical protein
MRGTVDYVCQATTACWRWAGFVNDAQEVVPLLQEKRSGQACWAGADDDYLDRLDWVLGCNMYFGAVHYLLNFVSSKLSAVFFLN